MKRQLKEKIMIDLFKIQAIKFGSFKLKSGLMSPVYIDLRVLISYPQVLKKVVVFYEEILKELKFDRLVAVPYTAIPIATAISLKINKPLIYTRKEIKDYGIKRPVEGECKKGEKMVLIDDMITTGGSKLEVVSLLTNLGLKVNQVVVLIDREQGGKEELEKNKIKLYSAFSLKDWIKFLFKKRLINQNKYQEVINYLKTK